MYPELISLINFAVSEYYRHEGVGRQMIEKLQSKLSCRRRAQITLHVRESNLPAQLFFKASGFRAIKVVRDYYGYNGEDAYVMVYQHEVAANMREILHTDRMRIA